MTLDSPLTPGDAAAAWGDDPYDQDEYDALVDTYGPETIPAPTADDTIEADKLADWHVRKLNQLAEVAEADDARMKAAIAQLKVRRAELAAKHERARGWHLDALTAWHRAHHPGVTSVALPSGTWWTGAGGWGLPEPDTPEAADALRAALGDDETVVFEPQPDKFRSNELRRLVVPGPRGEPGSKVELTLKATGEKLDGVHGVVRGYRKGIR